MTKMNHSICQVLKFIWYENFLIVDKKMIFENATKEG